MAIASLERLASQTRVTQEETPVEPKRPGRPRKNPSAASEGIAIQKRTTK